MSEVVNSQLVPQKPFDPLITMLNDVEKQYLHNVRQFVLSSVKYHQALKYLLPLAHDNKPVLYALCAWGASLRPEDSSKGSSLLLKSMSLCNRLYGEVVQSNANVSQQKLLELVASLTSHVIVGSSIGSSFAWSSNFFKLCIVYKKFGLHAFEKNPRNTDFTTWLLRSFFYHDVLKLTSRRNSKTAFPLSEYKRILDHENSPNRDVSMDQYNPLMGCCVELFLLLAELNNFYDEYSRRVEAVFVYYNRLNPLLDTNDTNAQYEIITGPEYLEYENARIEFHDWLDNQSRNLMDKITSAKPNLPNISSLEDVQQNEILLTYFEATQVTLQLFLLSKIRRMSSLDYEVKGLMLHLFSAMRVLLNSNLSPYLSFPLLIAGVVAAERHDRLTVKMLYLGIVSRNGETNIQRIWTIIEELWKLNPDGNKHLDWQSVIDRLGYNICVW
ncbi:putative transcriptional regulatory protein [Ogataea parapolymorpha DL-1]|uniref:Transcriptional regulatory protein n=1 Tax=Ogataea parapolymorpha (strain ATCC 26012 / BCRC 20466 / JCM 22074 / NRRL Y-7560 / DL-1) TaxID=871575 RepID=W1QF87_OGAPD|nr:putative transcriptional regulatory protein [Ogataea parapolymorpha DL-1]ESX00742.1 putative transcriptional regulatory protein [Ogataea parapolymorpha DL-1]